MESFREYIKKCIAGDTDILVEPKYLNSIDFNDICVIIYLMTTQNKKVIFTPELKSLLGYDVYEASCEIIIQDVHNKEELAVLMYLAGPYVGDCHHIYLMTPSGRYKMSPAFSHRSRSCGVRDYPLSVKIIAMFDIPEAISTAIVDMFLLQYQHK